METHVRYLARSPIFEKEKAFSIDFPVDHVEGARRTNHEAENRPMTVAAIEDPSHWKLDVHGFCMLHAETHLDPHNVYTKKREVQDAYWYEIEAILHKHFPQYSRLESYDLTVRATANSLVLRFMRTLLTDCIKVRKRDPEYPAIARGYRDEYEQPASVAHSDYSRDGGFLTLQHCFPGQDDYWKDKDFDMLNVWRPLTGPTDDWPLALCDYTTINTEEDIRLNDAIRRDLVDENSLLQYNEAHKWYYFKDQGANDLLVFRNSDSHGRRTRGFHAAVFNPEAKGPPRESVEVRLVAFY